jgi:hypothetical protein
MHDDPDLLMAARDSAAVKVSLYNAGLRDGISDISNDPIYAQKSFDAGFQDQFVKSLHISFMIGYIER